MNERIREIYMEARRINDMSDNIMEVWEFKFAELIVQECLEQIHLECEDFANGNCFADHALWESVTREYGENKERGFDPVGMSIHFDKMLKKHFGVENA